MESIDMMPTQTRTDVLNLATDHYLRTQDKGRLDALFGASAIDLDACDALVEEVLSFVRSGHPITDERGQALDAATIEEAFPKGLSAAELASICCPDYLGHLLALRGEKDDAEVPCDPSSLPVLTGGKIITFRGIEVIRMVISWAYEQPGGTTALGEAIPEAEPLTDAALADLLSKAFMWAHSELALEVDEEGLAEAMAHDCKTLPRERAQLLGPDFGQALRHCLLAYTDPTESE